MGQRSQIYIRFFENNKNRMLIARDFGWNYGERMISRARYTLDWLTENSTDNTNEREFEKKLVNIINTNFDMLDSMLSTDIIKKSGEMASSEDELEVNFFSYENDDGILFIDIMKDGSLKYCFTNGDGKLLSPEGYMEWDNKDWETDEYISDAAKETCKKNMQYISEHYVMMTESELNEFTSYKYDVPLLYCDECGALPGTYRCDYIAFAVTSPYTDSVTYIMQKRNDETGTELNLFTIKKGTQNERVFKLRNNMNGVADIFENFRSGKISREEADAQVWNLLNTK